jgi:hypothetical protein
VAVASHSKQDEIERASGRVVETEELAQQTLVRRSGLFRRVFAADAVHAVRWQRHAVDQRLPRHPIAYFASVTMRWASARTSSLRSEKISTSGTICLLRNWDRERRQRAACRRASCAFPRAGRKMWKPRRDPPPSIAYRSRAVRP